MGNEVVSVRGTVGIYGNIRGNADEITNGGPVRIRTQGRSEEPIHPCLVLQLYYVVSSVIGLLRLLATAHSLNLLKLPIPL